MSWLQTNSVFDLYNDNSCDTFSKSSNTSLLSNNTHINIAPLLTLSKETEQIIQILSEQLTDDGVNMNNINELVNGINKKVRAINLALNRSQYEFYHNSYHNNGIDTLPLSVDYKEINKYSLNIINEYVYQLFLPSIPYRSASMLDAPQLEHKQLIKEVINHLININKNRIRQFSKADILIQYVCYNKSNYADHDHRFPHYLINNLVPSFIPDDSPAYINLHHYLGIPQLLTAKGINLIDTTPSDCTILYIIDNSDNSNKNLADFLKLNLI